MRRILAELAAFVLRGDGGISVQCLCVHAGYLRGSLELTAGGGEVVPAADLAAGQGGDSCADGLGGMGHGANGAGLRAWAKSGSDRLWSCPRGNGKPQR